MRALSLWSILGFLVAFGVCLPVRAASGEDPHCGTLQAQLLKANRDLTVLKSAVRGDDTQILRDKAQIQQLEAQAISEGKSPTGNISNETRYYKDDIAETGRPARQRSSSAQRCGEAA